MACQLCLTVVLMLTVQKFPLRDTEFILPYKRVCQSGSFLGAFGECECRMGIWNRLEKLQTWVTVTVFTENALLWFKNIFVVYRTSISSVYSTSQLIKYKYMKRQFSALDYNCCNTHSRPVGGDCGADWTQKEELQNTRKMLTRSRLLWRAHQMGLCWLR